LLDAKYYLKDLEISVLNQNLMKKADYSGFKIKNTSDSSTTLPYVSLYTCFYYLSKLRLDEKMQ